MSQPLCSASRVRASATEETRRSVKPASSRRNARAGGSCPSPRSQRSRAGRCPARVRRSDHARRGCSARSVVAGELARDLDQHVVRSFDTSMATRAASGGVGSRLVMVGLSPKCRSRHLHFRDLRCPALTACLPGGATGRSGPPSEQVPDVLWPRDQQGMRAFCRVCVAGSDCCRAPRSRSTARSSRRSTTATSNFTEGKMSASHGAD